MTHKQKVVLSSFLGNMMEFYDFTLYGVMMLYLSQAFFPSDNDFLSILHTMAVFAVGYVVRPLGALYFGRIGDKIGRKQALNLSILMMGLPTFIIGMLPPYEDVGIVAPITVVLCRLIQGFSAGGEYNGSVIFALENFKKGKGFIGGLIGGSCVAGAILATLCGVLVSQKGMPPESWRIPFIIGSMISFVAYFIRYKLNETPEFEGALATPQPSITWKPYVLTAIFGAFNGVFSYTLFGFLTVYMVKFLHFQLQNSFLINMLGLVAFMIACPVAGFLLDQQSHKKFMKNLALWVGIIGLMLFPAMASKIDSVIIMAQIMLGILTGFVVGSGHGFMQNLFPVSKRYKGVAVSFSLGMGISGGLTPYMQTKILLLFNNVHSPSFLLGIFAFIFYVAVSLLYEKGYQKPSETIAR